MPTTGIVFLIGVALRGFSKTNRKTTDPSAHPPKFNKMWIPNLDIMPPARLGAWQSGKSAAKKLCTLKDDKDDEHPSPPLRAQPPRFSPWLVLGTLG
ncbi:hypothetical protein LY78DRAFT_282236 [Colletotrichum sublineola]|nr:hypothetical protein LY78DRAFT_282236 [Colletotrichum sublineola]